jgi:hypothetical protein
MELSDYIIEIDNKYGILSLNIISLTKGDLVRIANRNNNDYFVLVAAMRIIRESIMSANQMRQITDEWFDTDLHLSYYVEAIKKAHIANKIRAGEKFDEEETPDLEQMLLNVKNNEELKRDVETIRSFLKSDAKGPMSKFLGVEPDFFFILKTAMGQESFGTNIEGRGKKNSLQDTF